MSDKRLLTDEELSQFEDLLGTIVNNVECGSWNERKQFLVDNLSEQGMAQLEEVVEWFAEDGV